MEKSLAEVLREEAANAPAVSFEGIYDLSYLIDDQTVVFWDVKYKLFHYMNYHLFWAFIRAHYNDPELQLKIRDAVLNFKKVRIIPSKEAAGILPVTMPDFVELTLKIMNETVGLQFTSLDAKKNFFLDNYGINLL